MRKRYLFLSDFDQTLSFDDSGHLLSDLLGIGGFVGRVAGLSRLNLVQEGAELTYLLRHDPEYRRVRKSHLVETGQRIRLKRNIGLLIDLLQRGMEGLHFDFYVVSAAPEDVVQSALRDLVPPDHIIATKLTYGDGTGEIDSIVNVSAGYGKVAAVAGLRARLGIPGERVVYVGDGTSDLHVMLHVNREDGLTIAASEARHITQVARRTVMSDDALSVLVPVLEEIAGYSRGRIREFFESHGVLIQDWDRVRTDWLRLADRADLGDVGGSAAPAWT